VSALRFAVLRIVRMAAATPTIAQRIIVLAIPNLHQDIHEANIFKAWSAAMTHYNLEISLADRRADNLDSQLPWIPLSGALCCVDAAFRRETGDANVGIAIQGSSTQHSIGLEGTFSSSYEAEMAGLALLSLSITNSDHARHRVLNDNRGVFEHLRRVRGLPANMRPRASLSNTAVTLALSIHPDIAIAWVKGHVTHEPSPEETLNNRADKAAASSDVSAIIRKSQLESTAIGIYTQGHRLISKISALHDPVHHRLWERWDEFAATSVVDKSSIAFYYSPRSNSLTLPTAVIEDLLSIRMRAIFTHGGSRRTCAACGTSIEPHLHHLFLECAHPSHTVTPLSFYQHLTQNLGRGWWSPPCLALRECSCRPDEGYHCGHRYMALAPKNRCNRQAQLAWAKYLHARLQISHPSNRRNHIDESSVVN
jgi:hypothetical protein